MQKLAIGSIIALLVGFGAYQWYRTEQRERLIDSAIEDLAIRYNPLKLRDAAFTLKHMGPDAEKAIPALIDVLMLNDDSRSDSMQSLEKVKPEIAIALVAIGPSSVEPLLNAVREPKCRERGWGIRPQEASFRLPPLFKALGDMRTQFSSEIDSSAIDETLNDLITNHDSRDCSALGRADPWRYREERRREDSLSAVTTLEF